MPGNNTPTTEQRLQFVTLANTNRFTISESADAEKARSPLKPKFSKWLGTFKES